MVVDFDKQLRHYLQGRKCYTRTDLRTVLKDKEPEEQLARWTEFMDSFIYDTLWEIEVLLDLITESSPDTVSSSTEYKLALKKRSASALEAARRHVGKAPELQKRNYDNQVISKPFRVGDSVWLYNSRRKKDRNTNLDRPRGFFFPTY